MLAQHRDRPGGCLDLRPAATRRQLRVRPHVGHLVDARIGDADAFQQLGQLRGAVAREGLDDDRAPPTERPPSCR
jgi:hypothetical protein